MGDTDRHPHLRNEVDAAGARSDATDDFALVRHMQDGFALHEIICDESGVPVDYRFLFVNHAFENLTGLEASRLVGRTVLEVLPDTESRWIAAYGRVALTGEPVVVEDYSQELDRHFRVKSYSPAPGRFVAVIVDITESKSTEASLRRHISSLADSRLPALGSDFEELLDVQRLQRLQDEIAVTTGMGSIMVRPNGSFLTEPSGYHNLCARLLGGPNAHLCIEFKRSLGEEATLRPLLSRCPHGNLWAAASTIMIGSQHVATWILGGALAEGDDGIGSGSWDAILDEDPDELDDLRSQSPLVSIDRLKHVANVLQLMANTLSDLAARSLAQTRMLNESRLQEELNRLRADIPDRARTRQAAELLQSVVDELCSALECTHGFFHLLNANGDSVTAHVWSTNVELPPAHESPHAPAPLDPGGVCAQCARTLKPHIRNEYPFPGSAKLPANHVKLNRFLAVPVLIEGRVLAVVTLCNKPVDFTDSDVTAVTEVARVALDCLERARIEEALQESELLYRTVVEASADGFLMANDAGMILHANDTYCFMSGYSAQELRGMPIATLDAAKDEPEILEHTKRILERGSDLFETRHRRKDGTEFDVEISALALGPSLVVFARDITERVESHRRLEEAEKLVRMGQQSGRSASWEWVPASDEIKWSRGVWSLMGLDPDEDEPSFALWAASIHPDDRDEILRALGVSRDEGAPLEFEFRLAAQPDRWLLSRGMWSESASESPQSMYGVLVDISQLKRAQHEIVELTERLRQISAGARRAEELQRRSLAEELHDRVSQYLAVAKMNLQLAGDTADSPELIAALGLIGEALTETRAITAELSPRILHELGLSAALEWLVEHSVRLGVTGRIIKSERPGCLSEETAVAVFRATRELIANIAKHAGVHEYRIAWEDNGGEFRLTVSDDGAGFDPEERESTLLEGGGFGLFNMSEHIAQLDGALTISSSPGAGTTVVITVPCSSEESDSGYTNP